MQDYINELEENYKTERAEKNQYAQAQMSMFNQPSEENLIQWQLDLKEDLDKIYHLLNGHQPKYTTDGEVEWVESEDTDLRPFNKFGVQLIMNVLSFYLNRNTLLSNYDQDTINGKMLDFGIEMSDLIYTRYEEMGMDTIEKIKLFPMIFRELVDTVHSAYQRSLKGMERESLRTARTVVQNDPVGGYNRQQPNQQQKGRQFSIVNPRSWFG